MKMGTGIKTEPINTLQVFTENEQVFIKNGAEDWFPVSFHWTNVVV